VTPDNQPADTRRDVKYVRQPPHRTAVHTSPMVLAGFRRSTWRFACTEISFPQLALVGLPVQVLIGIGVAPYAKATPGNESS
jgi:hypothetical protein